MLDEPNNQPLTEVKESAIGKTTLAVGIAITAVVLIAGGWWFLFRKSAEPEINKANEPAAKVVASTAANVTSTEDPVIDKMVKEQKVGFTALSTRTEEEKKFLAAIYLDKGLDSDNDGVTDEYELNYWDFIGPKEEWNTNPVLKSRPPALLAQKPEFKSWFRHLDEKNPDTDNDGLKDGEEFFEYSTDPFNDDSDKDGLKDGEEVLKYKTDPRKADTDGDGFKDGDEVKNGYNPLGPGKK